MTEVARCGALIGGAGLALLLVAGRRELRLAGLILWGIGLAALGAYLVPESRTTQLAAAGGAMLVAAALGTWLLLRYRYLLAFATLACIPARIPVQIGPEEANLLIPLYAVVGSAAFAFGWRLLRGEDRPRELGPVAWPLAAVVLWASITILWTDDVRKGAIFIGAFVLPFGLVAIWIAGLPWRGRWLAWLWGGLVGTALVYAAVGWYQWVAREVFWNPGVIVGNAYAPFFRVNSVFWDPSVYGRYLVVAILATLAGILLGGARRWQAAGLYAIVAAIWLGLIISFSQSSFVALSVGVVAAAAVTWGVRTMALLVAVALIAVVGALAMPQVRGELVGKSRSSINKITSGRSNLVGQGIRIAVDHPVVGVGVGGFNKAYASRAGIPGKDPRRTSSHTTPVTIAAEQGFVGLAFFGWLVVAMLWSTLHGLGRGFTSRASLAVGVALLAILVHSLFYAAFFEDPMAWALLGLVGLTATVPKKAGVP